MVHQRESTLLRLLQHLKAWVLIKVGNVSCLSWWLKKIRRYLMAYLQARRIDNNWFIFILFYYLRLLHETERKRKNKGYWRYTKTKNNKCLIRNTTTAVSQLQWSQSSKNILIKQTVKLRDWTRLWRLKKTTKMDRRLYYVKFYMMDRWFSRIVGPLGRNYILSRLHSTYQ